MNPLTLFLLFCQFGCVSFGGGYVLVPMLIAEFVGKRQIITLETFGNLVSVAQVTPGPVGINSATYLGYLQGGAGGSLAASFGLILPSLILGPLVFYSVRRWKESLLVSGLLAGVRPAALALVFFAVFLFLGMSVFTAPIPFGALLNALRDGAAALPADFHLSPGALVIGSVSLFLIWKRRLSTTLLILISAAAGVVICR